ncbi:unnamed protein product, partial [Meganyctiphanes norvegica]
VELGYSPRSDAIVPELRLDQSHQTVAAMKFLCKILLTVCLGIFMMAPAAYTRPQRMDFPVPGGDIIANNFGCAWNPCQPGRACIANSCIKILTFTTSSPY